MYPRTLQQIIEKRLGSGKAIILMGPRQVGKTTLIETILNDQDYLFLSGDDPSIRAMLTEPNTEDIRNIIGQHPYVFIDEAQRIKGIGLTMKIIVDQFKAVQLIASGSSAFELSNHLNEPLTGRKWEYQLFPMSWEEFEDHVGYLKAEQQLEQRLIYGFYPDVLNHAGEEKAVLSGLLNSYLYKDVLTVGGIQKPDELDKLVRALAFQVGSEVNLSELGQMSGLDGKTVSRYIDVLEKAYVIFRLTSFSRNLRNEIKSNAKIYFIDNGIRNMIIGNLDPLELRPDKGALWENFLVSERIKQMAYRQRLARCYFWRSRQQQEVDFVEDEGGKITGFEFKWNAGGRGRLKLPRTFTQAYDAQSRFVDRSNFREFVM